MDKKRKIILSFAIPTVISGVIILIFLIPMFNEINELESYIDWLKSVAGPYVVNQPEVAYYIDNEYSKIYGKFLPIIIPLAAICVILIVVGKKQIQKQMIIET